jgi:quinolinate synthase
MLDEEIYQERIEACWPKVPEPVFSEQEKDVYRKKIKRLLKEQDAVLIVHYYIDADIQKLAEETGSIVADSLDMAKFGAKHSAGTLVIVGVRFMGETAKILNPEKRVLMPDLGATCSLDEGCDPEDFAEFRKQHLERIVVVYANTSAAIKAQADWVVTSSNALDIVNYLADQGKKILWAPDRYLGSYIKEQTGADMVLWQGSCVVHEEFRAEALQELRKEHPEAAVLVHPESPSEVVAQADLVGSTSQLLKASKELPNKEFIVATDKGIFYQMQLASPDKKFIPAPTGGVGGTCRACAHCPWMAMNNLKNLSEVFENKENEVLVDEEIRKKAFVALERMIRF